MKTQYVSRVKLRCHQVCKPIAALLVFVGLAASLSQAQDYYSQRGSDIDGQAAFDQSGGAVSLSSDGSVLAIGAISNDDGGVNAGHVRIYLWNGFSWVQRGADIDGKAAHDESGKISLSSDGSVVAIGAALNDGAGYQAGHVCIYSWDGSTWTQRGADIEGEATGDASGTSVSLSSDGNVVAIGAFLNDGNGENAGHVRVYVWDGSAWMQRGADIDGEAAGDESAWSVALSSDGNVLAVGAILNDGSGNQAGHVRVHAWDGTAWAQRGLDIDGEAAGDMSGFSVSLSSDGDVLAIGAIGNDGGGYNSGHVRIYAWDGSTWMQRGADIDGEAADDESGRVSLSSDGSIVAIGATLNDDAGNEAGHVRIYTWDGTSWKQRGLDIDGEAAGDMSGFSVSISSDGDAVAIGAIGNDGAGDRAGHVRVYDYVTSNTGILRDDLPTQPRLHPVHPNPLSDRAEFRFDLPEGTDVGISIYDILGRKVSHVVSGYYPSGNHRIHWFDTGLSQGQYYVILTTENKSIVMPFVVVR